MRKINKEIFGLAIPNIISNISIPLLSTVDTALMGHLSAKHIGAVGVGSMVFNFIYWNFGFLRMGTTGITAEAFGADNKSQIINTLARSLALAILIAIVVFVLKRPLGELSYTLLNVSSEQYEMVRSYFLIRIFAAPATMMVYAFKGWFFGMQNAVFPLIMTVTVNVVNIALSAYLVIYQSWDIEGVAWGTVGAQYLGLITAIILYQLKYRKFNSYLDWQTVINMEKLKAFFKINRDLFLRTVCLTFAFGFFYSQSSKGGELVLAANIILLQFINWMSYGVDGFAHASESLVGKYKGAKDTPMVKQAIKFSFIWGFVLAISFAIIYLVFGDQLLSIFSKEPSVIQFTSKYLFWVILFPIAAFLSYIWDGVYVGLSASRSMRNSMFVSLVVYLLSYYLLSQTFGFNALWTALFLFLLTRAMTQHYLYKKHGLAID